MENPNEKKAKALFDKGVKLLEESESQDERLSAIDMITEAANLGLQEAKDWIDDYTFDDDAGVQAES